MSLVTLLLAALAATATPSADVYVMRHLNTPPGQRDPDLLPEGRRTAEALARQFQGSPPVAIFVTDYRRTRQTVAPLAARLGLTPMVYDPRDVAGLVERVRAVGGPVLIVGHSNTVGGLIAALGGASPGELGESEFGDIWHIAADGTTTRLRIGD
ncbi:phosphoglycerate mutase family protein [Sphingosinicella ginsenosidimutans]|uniref:Histidine phosphatase family protein n=1 Tax=Allosphingosinicella ginsenosidimutans TaxID=1176539 RepID=A0A5C6TUV6_9SPHN|nr:phosphoglycerate mutase family protein [Sphingosinicella ginsenosidimutans]TXC63900.1 histidine phosphatase family protein [Sphingosinicella ginsenosidimutans]